MTGCYTRESKFNYAFKELFIRFTLRHYIYIINFFVREPAKQIDYQLPELPENEYYGPELSFKQQESTFKEKTVTLSAKDRSSGENVGFKKRRAADDMKKNMRRRTDDL